MNPRETDWKPLEEQWRRLAKLPKGRPNRALLLHWAAAMIGPIKSPAEDETTHLLSRLTYNLRSMETRLRQLGACDICWTDSWVPCEATVPGAVRDPKHPKRWIVCSQCFALEQLRELRAKMACQQAKKGRQR